MGIIKANVPHDVPVENAIKDDATNSIGTISMTGRLSLAMPATKAPVPNILMLAPKASYNKTIETNCKSSFIPLKPISTSLI